MFNHPQATFNCCQISLTLDVKTCCIHFMLSQFLTDKLHTLGSIDCISARWIAANEINKILGSHFQVADITMQLVQRGRTQHAAMVLFHMWETASIVGVAA